MEGSTKLAMKVGGQSGLGKDIVKSPKKATPKAKRGRPKKIGLGNAVDGPRPRRKKPQTITKARFPKSPLVSKSIKRKQNTSGIIENTKNISKNKVFISKPIDIRILSAKKIEPPKSRDTNNLLQDLEAKEKKSYEDFLESTKMFADRRARLVLKNDNIESDYSFSEDIVRENYSLYVCSRIDRLNHLIDSKLEIINVSEEKIELLLDKITKTEELIKYIHPTDNAVQLYANLEAYEKRLEKTQKNKQILENDLEELINNFLSSNIEILCNMHRQLEEDILASLENEEPKLQAINKLVGDKVYTIIQDLDNGLKVEKYLQKKIPTISDTQMASIKDLLIAATTRRTIEKLVISDLEELKALMVEDKFPDESTYLEGFIQNLTKLSAFESSILEIIRNNDQIKTKINHKQYTK